MSLGKDEIKYSSPAFSIDIEEPTERVQAFIDYYKNEPDREGADESLMTKHLILISASKTPTSSATFELDVAQEFGNRMGNMHGGAMALVYDMCTTMAMAPLATREFWWFGGVSRVLSVTYIRPVKVGMRIVIECEVLHVGSRLAAIRGVMRDKASGDLLSTAEHNKVSIKLPKM